ncbi:hypothetical protein ACFL1A_00595 [Patescibacteria group bacterium]
MNPENEINIPIEINDETLEATPGVPENGALPEGAGSLPANGLPVEQADNPPHYDSNGAG